MSKLSHKTFVFLGDGANIAFFPLHPKAYVYRTFQNT